MNNCPDLSGIRHVVLDMDGTIYKGGTIFPFTTPFLNRLGELGVGHTFITNNTSLGKAEYLRKLARLEIPANEENLVTSADATMEYLRHSLPDVRRLALLGTPSLTEQFEQAGFSMDWEQPEAVVVAFDTTLSYDRLCRTAWWISQGLPFLATHPDLVCPTDKPTVLVDCGAMCAALTAATGCSPLVFGKPLPAVMDPVLRRHGLMPHEVAMVGDRLSTDIVLAHRAGTLGVLVLTGEATREDAAAAAQPPHLIVEDLARFGAMLEQAKEMKCRPQSSMLHPSPTAG